MPMNNTEKNAYAAGPGRNARETAYRVIRDKIIGCELKPGEAISDKQLAEELQMSRTPVREAVSLAFLPGPAAYAFFSVLLIGMTLPPPSLFILYPLIVRAPRRL